MIKESSNDKNYCCTIKQLKYLL